MQFESRRLGTSELHVSPIGLGCVTFGREIDEQTSCVILDQATDRGITLLDTAAVYGEGASEAILGRWFQHRAKRDRVILATKVSGRLSRNRVAQSVEASLGRLGTDRIDLIQAHDWDGETPLEETLEAFDLLMQRGLVRACGCSNWSVTQLNKARSLAQDNGWAPLESVQPIYNLVDRRIEQALLGVCAAEQIGVISYSPLGAGFLTGKYRRDGPVPTGTRFDVKPAHRDIYFTDHGFGVVESLRAASRETERSMAQLALAWVFRQPAITSVLVGARTQRHIDQAFEAMKTSQTPELQGLFDRMRCSGLGPRARS